jgi:hypothetical protein
LLESFNISTIIPHPMWVVENQRRWWIPTTLRRLLIRGPASNVGNSLILKGTSFYALNSILAKLLLFLVASH